MPELVGRPKNKADSDLVDDAIETQEISTNRSENGILRTKHPLLRRPLDWDKLPSGARPYDVKD